MSSDIIGGKYLKFSTKVQNETNTTTKEDKKSSEEKSLNESNLIN